VLKVLAKVEILVPSYGFCSIPPCEEFADSVCDEFFSLPLFPPATLCDENNFTNTCAQNGCSTCNNCNSCNSCNGCNRCGTL
jgi:hypothetical protein